MSAARHIINASPAERTVMYKNGNTNDIIRVIMYADSKSAPYINRAAVSNLQGGDDYATLENIFYFVRDSLQYRTDRPGREEVRSPGYLFQSGTGDCKSYSVATGALCRAFGITYRYRFTAPGTGNFQHVYVVATIPGRGDVVMDSVYGHFDREARYARKRDVKPGSAAAIGAIGSGLTSGSWIIFLLIGIWLLSAKKINQ